MLEADSIYKNGIFYYEEMKDFVQATHLFDMAINIENNNSDYYFYRGCAKFNLGKNDSGQYKKAILDFNKAIALKNNNSDYFFYRGQTKYFLKQYEEAILDFDKAIELDYNNDKYLCYRGLAEFELGNYDNALFNIEKAIKLNRRSYGCYRDVLEILEKNKIYMSDIEYYIVRGKIKCTFEDDKGALKDFNKAIKIDSNNAEVYYGSGLVKYKWRTKKEAIEDFNKAIKLNPNEPKYYYARGIVTNSITDFEMANRLGFKYAGLFYQMFLLTEGNESIEYISKSITLDPKNPKYYYARGCKKIELKQYVEGMTDYIEVLKINHTYFTPESKYYIDEKEYEKYIKDCDEAIKLDTNNSDFYYFRGYIKMLLHKNKDAIADYNKCIKLDSSNIQAYLDRGNIYYNTKNYKNAIVDFEKYLEQNPDDIEVQYGKKFAEILARK